MDEDNSEKRLQNKTYVTAAAAINRFKNVGTYKETLPDLKNDYSVRSEMNMEYHRHKQNFEKRRFGKASTDAPLRAAVGRKARARAPYRK